MKVFLKGGVWKNSEDEVLKAAVQKYGKQQWSRVASLLNRKTAKQAKARWYEWLDPSIRKTEWSRQEEEKLLHLAKLLPAQWKTIGPLVGRTATQCQEHYEQLLDQAATATAGTGEQGDAADDATAALRQQAGGLRAGQIDAHPETKPARPDPIDMDEDEMEMLQEARARLANTQGKKAKRKQREKMLAAAKRLADLQKRRELKAAGLVGHTSSRRKSRKEIDLATEIPFYKPAPAGFHDTTTEVQQAERLRQETLHKVDLHQVNEKQYRTRDREAAARKKRQEARLAVLESSNEKYSEAALKRQEVEETAHLVKGPLQLPAPTLTDQEFGDLGKWQSKQQAAAAAYVGEATGNAATQALLGDYSQRPLPTPMRTPHAGAGGASVSRDLMQEARTLRQLERGQTPLIVSQQHVDTDTQEEASTLEQPDAAASRAMANRTPGGASVATAGSMGPPARRRDALGLNHPKGLAADGSDAASVGASTFASSTWSLRERARQERKAAKRARMELEAALAALPAPQFEYELALPNAAEGDDEQNDAMQGVVVMDQADLEAAEQEKMRLEAKKLYEARSSVLKRTDLPRPTRVVELDPTSSSVSLKQEDSLAAAQALLDQEMAHMVQHDAAAFPVLVEEQEATTTDPAGKKKKKRKHKEVVEPSVTSTDAPLPTPMELDVLDPDALQAARLSVEQETAALVNEKVSMAIQIGKASSRSDALQVLVQANVQAAAAGANEEESVEQLRAECEALQQATAVLQKRNDKIQAKQGVKTGGYAKRAQKLHQDLLQVHAGLSNALIEERVYKTLQSQETVGAQNRMDHLSQEIAGLKAQEATLQKRYGDLLVDLRRVKQQQQQASVVA